MNSGEKDMKVMVIAGEYPSEKAGGIGSVSYELIKKLERRGIKYRIVCRKQYKFETKKAVFLDTVRGNLTGGISFGLSFRKFILKELEQWDVFHFHLPQARWPLLLSPKIVRERGIASVHTTAFGSDRYLYQRTPLKYLNWLEKVRKIGLIKMTTLIEKLSLEKPKVITAVSSGIKQEIQRTSNKNNVKVIHNGIDVSKFQKPQSMEEECPTILFVGRLTAQKGLFLGIKALAQVEENFDFLIVGSGPYRRQLEEYCQKNKVNARFLGFVKTSVLFRLYSQADLLLMPSFYEGLPMVGIEGAGSALPIVAFESARVNDIVCEENKKFLVEVGDIEKLSESINFLLADKEVRRKIGKKNRENVFENFTSERMAEEYIETYKKVAKQKE